MVNIRAIGQKFTKSEAKDLLDKAFLVFPNSLKYLSSPFLLTASPKIDFLTDRTSKIKSNLLIPSLYSSIFIVPFL